MSNTICIKHGASVPSNNILQPYELGYVTSTGTLVIGDSNKEAKNLNYLQIDDKGYIPFDSELVFNSNADTPRIWIRTDETGVKTSYGIDTSTGQAHIIQYTPIILYFCVFRLYVIVQQQ